MRIVIKCLVAVVALLMAASGITFNTVFASDPVEDWALIICGSSGGSFANDTAYMYHVMSEHYDFDGINYLSVYPSDPGVNGSATKNSVRAAVTNWLGGKSDANDRIFIYFSSHGGGCLTCTYDGIYDPGLHYGRNDSDFDEWYEHYEGDLHEDVNGDDDWDDYVAVDECLFVADEFYWDDELSDDLDTLDYNWLTFIAQGCFSGGLIDDISAEGRIIMTSANETGFSWSDLSEEPEDPGYGYNEWSETFIDALHREKTYWDETNLEVVDTDIPVDADYNDDGHVSMWEAWYYAWDNDPLVSKWEIPWLDDDGNRCPTHVCVDGNCQDALDPDDGDNAAGIWFPVKPVASFYASATTVIVGEVLYFDASDSYDPDGTIVCYYWDLGDGNNAVGVTVDHAYSDPGSYTVTLTVTDNDGLTDSASSTITVGGYWLTVKTYLTNGNPVSGMWVYIDGEYVGASWVTEEVGYGTHTVQIDPGLYRDGYWYIFQYWEGGDTSNPRTVNVDNDVTLKAYYEKTTGGGGDPGCPILSVYNGTTSVEEGLLDIHNLDGIDEVANRTLTVTPEPVRRRYLMRLTEHPQTRSHIDQVQLFATLTNGIEIKLPLLSAVHCNDGNVLWKLLWSDDVRADTLGADHNNGTSEWIDLKFWAPRWLEIEKFTFVIEGYNIYIK